MIDVSGGQTGPMGEFEVACRDSHLHDVGARGMCGVLMTLRKVGRWAGFYILQVEFCCLLNRRVKRENLDYILARF